MDTECEAVDETEVCVGLADNSTDHLMFLSQSSNIDFTIFRIIARIVYLITIWTISLFKRSCNTVDLLKSVYPCAIVSAGAILCT